ncbi:MAG: modification methylase, partial [Beggiatoa sp. IS2]
MIKSPLRYPGGKSRAVELISSIIPDFSEYREPFVGGGSVFVYLKQIYPNRKYWINDIYYELYEFWEITQNSIEQLVEQVYCWKNQFAEGKQLHRFLIENKENFNDIEIASAFFILNR